jgi:hypothetical protein
LIDAFVLVARRIQLYADSALQIDVTIKNNGGADIK